MVIFSNYIVPVILAIVLLLLLWPDKGLVALRRRSRQNAMRILIEDTLKVLFDFEEKKKYAAATTLIETLSITKDEAQRLLDRLVDMGLVRNTPEGVTLAAEGRAYALRVIRVHRLWERYLADQTSMRETQWHRSAEEKEHFLTQADADALAAKLGNPDYDPHGDPIPTSGGEIIPQRGQLLTMIPSGAYAQITHIEDEPAEIYAQLVAQRLYPGMQIHILESNEDRIRFEAEGEENSLSRRFAENVTVIPLIEEKRITDAFIPLSTLELGEEAEVIALSKACRGQQRRRLMDLGVVPGTNVSAKMKSFTGDPIAYEIRGTTIALRKQQADQIFIKKRIVRE
jgi:DtxR family Mn-dependent transcriptional regulator